MALVSFHPPCQLKAMVQLGQTIVPDLFKTDGPFVMPGDRVLRVAGIEKEALLDCIYHFLEDTLFAEDVVDSTTQIHGLVFDEDFTPMKVEITAYSDVASSFAVFKHITQNNAVSLRTLVFAVASSLGNAGHRVEEPTLQKEDEFVGLCDFEFDDDSDCDFTDTEPSWVECIDAEVPNLGSRSAWQREEALQVLARMALSSVESRTPLAMALGKRHTGMLPAMISSIGAMSLQEAYPFAVVLQYATSEAEGAALMKPFGDALADVISKEHCMPKLVTSKLVHALANIAAHMMPCLTGRNQRLLLKTDPEKEGTGQSISERTTAGSMEWHGSQGDEDDFASLDLIPPTFDIAMPC